ncbi:proton-conducting transporter membrane subunit, partial [Thermococcus sp.]|uniref:proton-conducting transporter transmembrane domain-containing protein n=1 Tax=Thermococcus sp. TaxID=35749 RepID=UPI00260EFB16
LNRLKGLARVMPFTAIFTFIAAMSIAGTPPFNGFMSKWLIYQSTFLSGNGLIVFLGVMALFISAATLASFLKFYTTAFGGEPEDITANAKEVPFPMLLGKGLLASLCLLLGLVPGLILPLLLSPGEALSGVKASLSTNYWLVTVKPLGGAESYFKPVLFVVAFTFVVLAMYLAFPPKGRTTEPWRLGEPVTRRDYKFKAVNYYEPFEEYIHGLYHLGEELSHIGGKITGEVGDAYFGISILLHTSGDKIGSIVSAIANRGIAGGYFALSTFLSRLGSAFGGIIVAIGRRYTSLGELYLDETFLCPLVKIARNLGFVLDEGFSRPNGPFTLALIVLGIMVIILAGWGL